MATFIALLASGVVYGAVLGLIASGFVVLYKATGVINFAHGDLVTLGAYLAFWAISDLGLPVLGGYAVALALMFAIGVVLERIAYAPLRKRPPLIVLIATLAAALIIRAGIGLWMGSAPKALAGFVGRGAFRLGGAFISYQRLMVVVVAGVAIAALALMFQRTGFGRQVRALADDAEVAELYGVEVRKVSLLAWGLSSAVACLAGVLIAPATTLDLNFGFSLMVAAFAAAVLGGFGSLGGALAGAMFIGILQQVVGGYWLQDYATVLPYAVLLLVIAVRPQGFLPGAARL